MAATAIAYRYYDLPNIRQGHGGACSLTGQTCHNDVLECTVVSSHCHVVRVLQGLLVGLVHVCESSHSGWWVVAPQNYMTLYLVLWGSPVGEKEGGGEGKDDLARMWWMGGMREERGAARAEAQHARMQLSASLTAQTFSRRPSRARRRRSRSYEELAVMGGSSER